MKKVFCFFILTSFFIISCTNVDEPSTNNKNTKDFNYQKKEKVKEVNLDYSNPAFMAGSSFGNFFQIMYKTGRFKEMLKFTSKETKKKYGEKKLLRFYREMDFGYNIKLQSKNEIDNIITLNYTAEIMATTKIIRMDIVLENDTAKLVLNSLNTVNPFLNE